MLTDEEIQLVVEAKDKASEIIERIIKKLHDIVPAAEESADGASKSVAKMAEEFAKSHPVMVGTAVAGTAVAAAALEIGTRSIEAASKYQEASAKLAAHANISQSAAEKVGDAFLTTAGETTFSAEQMMDAFAPVSGHLELLTGHALDATDSLTLMRAATDLAEGSGNDLGTATKALSDVMVAYHMKISDVTQVSDILENTSRLAGIGVGEVASAVDRLKGRLGVAAPSLGDTGTLMAEMSANGITGSRSIMMVNSAFNTLTGGSKGTTAELEKLGIHVFDSNGKFLGMQKVIEELQPKLSKLSDQQRETAEKTLFGAGAAGVMDKVVQGGAATWETYSEKVNEAGAAHEAAEKAASTYEGTQKKLEASMKDASVALGEALLPLVQRALDVFMKIVGPILTWITQNKELAAAILITAGAIGAVVAAMSILLIVMTIFAGHPVVLAITLILAAVALLALGIYELIQHWDVVVKFLRDVWDGFVGWFRGVMDGFVSWWNGVWASITGWARDTWDGFVGWFRDVANGFVSWWRSWWDPFAKVVSDVWDGIVTVLKTALAVVIAAVVGPWVGVFHVLADGFTWLWKNIIVPAWDGSVEVMRIAWGFINANVVKPILDAIDFMGKMWDWYWKSVVTPVWNGIQQVISSVWIWLVANVMNPIVSTVRNVGDAFTILWNGVIVPVWNGILRTISDVWNWLVDNVMTVIHMEVESLGILWNWFLDHVIQPVWQAIQDTIRIVWLWLKTNVFDQIVTAVDFMGKAFQRGVDVIRTAWGMIVDAAKRPVQFIIDTVYNHGIREVWNSIAGPLGLGQLPELHIDGSGGAGSGAGAGGGLYAMASGGRISGPGSGTSDSILARLSDGEFIVNAASTSRYLGLLQAINAGGLPGFADGGLVDIIGSLAHAALGGLGILATPLVKGLEAVADSMLGGTQFGQMLAGGVHFLGDGFLSFLMGKDSTAKASATGSAPSGDVAGWISAAMAAVGIAGQSWANGLGTIIQYESGGNPRAENDWDSNAAAGDPSRGLMQTIMSTFEAYRLSSLPDDIFDPVANIAAGIRYIQSRYGDINAVPGLVSLANGGGYVGYDSGGLLMPGLTLAYNGTGRPERVISPTGAGAGSVVVNVNVTGNNLWNDLSIQRLKDEISRAIVESLPMAGVQLRN